MLSSIRENINSPKQRSKVLINLLQEKSDPELYQIKKNLNDLMINFQKSGIQISFDHQLENESLKFIFESDEKTINEKLEELKNFPWNKFLLILRGEKNV